MKTTTNKTNNNKKRKKKPETTQVTQTVICHCASVACISFHLVLLLQTGTALKEPLYCWSKMSGRGGMSSGTRNHTSMFTLNVLWPGPGMNLCCKKLKWSLFTQGTSSTSSKFAHFSKEIDSLDNTNAPWDQHRISTVVSVGIIPVTNCQPPLS